MYEVVYQPCFRQQYAQLNALMYQTPGMEVLSPQWIAVLYQNPDHLAPKLKL